MKREIFFGTSDNCWREIGISSVIEQFKYFFHRGNKVRQDKIDM